MLNRLIIKNAALIEEAELSFAEGVNILSGETGAGKSVILDCIDFVLGAKADRDMVRTGCDECRVAAEFSPLNEKILAVLDELDIESDDALVITRRLTSEGKGSIRVNGVPVTGGMLRKITARLVDIHGQSEHFYLLKESNQLQLLDEIGGDQIKEIKKRLAQAIEERHTIVADMKKIGGDVHERERRLEILRFQIDEIERAELKEGEEEELSSLLTRYRNAEKILSGLQGACDCLVSEGGGNDAVSSARRYLSQISKFDDRYGALVERIENLLAEMEDIADTAESYVDELDVDEKAAARAETRLEEIKALKKKYGNSVEDVLKFLSRAQEECELLADSEDRFAVLTMQLENKEDELFALACELECARKSTAKAFSSRVVDELKTLNISSARFEIDFESFDRSDAPKTTSEGLGGVKYLFSANAGEPLKEMGKIISGGEMSRFMLAVKAQLSGADGAGAGTYIFDEIDAGISGTTARVVAEKFMKIARHSQIIAVTHSAQIAASADRSFLIEKKEEAGRTHTQIYEIEDGKKIKEIARLVGQADSEFAQKHAEELVEYAVSYKKLLK